MLRNTHSEDCDCWDPGRRYPARPGETLALRPPNQQRPTHSRPPGHPGGSGKGIWSGLGWGDRVRKGAVNIDSYLRGILILIS